MALIRLLLAGVAGVGFTACARAPALERSQDRPVVEARLERGRDGFGVVTVRGLDPRRPPDVSVRAGDDADAPPLAGTLTADGDSIRFIPRFPPGDIGLLRVTVGGVEHRFPVPAPPTPTPSTELVGISPAAAEIPGNQLRWYLEFSAAMREGEAARHVRLVDGAGREVEGAFLRVEEELWDPARRRLTLLFDMGRVKRGLELRERVGPPIVAGRDYAIVVDSAWRDARGAPLRRAGTHRFRAVHPDLRGPDPRAWRIAAPPAGARGALHVSLDGAVDHAMGAHLIGVWRRGMRIEGRATLGAGDAQWRFVPASDWSSGGYELRVSALLEDPAGNSVARAFEVSPQGNAPGAANGGWIAVPFSVARTR